MAHTAAARPRRAGLCLLLVVALAACDPSPSPSAATSAPGSTAGASTAPVATSGPAATQAGDVRLPPGAQFDGGSTSVPGEARPVATQFLTRAYFFGTADGHPEALYREGTPWLRTVIDDGAGYKPPSGSSLVGGDYFRVVDAAANDTSMVVLGGAQARDGDRPTGFDVLPESMIWVTRDGKAFERVDPRAVVDDAASLRLTAVAATTKGFVAVGSVLPRGFATPAAIVVLQSADGAAWTVAGRLEGEGTLYARGLFVDGDRLLIDATDQWCDATGLSYGIGLRTGITRAWTSLDAGTSWQAVDLAAAAPVLQQDAALTEGCPASPRLGALIELAQALDTEGSIVGLGGGAVIARSKDGTTLAISRDLASWTQVMLPGAVPIAADGRRPFAQSIVFEFGANVSLVALEDREDAPGRPQSGGCQVRWWRSGDDGTTWSTGPWGRPFSTCAGATFSFEQLRDSSVLLFGNVIKTSTTTDAAFFRTSGAGALIPWATCVPGPGVDCSFATIAHPVVAGADWSEINLAGATVTTAFAEGLRMNKANAYAALLSGRFRSADLSEALLSYAILEGDFSRADLHGAFLFHAIIRADLTLTMLGGAELSGATFGEGAICPDGNAPTGGAADAKAACRL